MKLAVVAAVTVGWTTLAPAQEVAKLGTRPSYTFSSPLLNGLGVKSLADLQGRPVMVEFWGTH